MGIPLESLCRQISLAEIESELADSWASDFWLRCWRGLVDRMAPEDELWVYRTFQTVASVKESPDAIGGFDQVTDGLAIDRLGLSDDYL